MLLAIDIGNTNTVLGAFDGDKLVHSWRVKTDARHTADELMLTFTGLLKDLPVTGISGCSTVPAALRELRAMLGRYWPGVPTVLVEPGIKTGVDYLAVGALTHSAPVLDIGLDLSTIRPDLVEGADR